MAGRVCVEVYRLSVFTQILTLSVGQNLHMKNIALHKPCNISSRHVTLAHSITGDCSAVINGDTETVLNTESNPTNCINTKLTDNSPFWWVDLGQEFIINKISIYGRTDYIIRMICVNVSLNGNVIKRFTDTNGWTDDKYDITVGRSGRVVNITKDCDSSDFVINLCQVQVMVCEDGWYGDNCTEECGYCAGDFVCDKRNGGCTSCQTGFQLPMCKECSTGYYSKNCSEQNGPCLNTTCEPDNVTCSSSCSQGYGEGLCSVLMPFQRSNAAVVTIVCPAVGAIVAVFVVVIVVLSLRCWMKKRSHHSSEAFPLTFDSSTAKACSGNNPENTSGFVKPDDSVNIYDNFQSRAVDDGTATYTCLRYHIDWKETETDSVYSKEKRT
ncbi:multiple epidermal growth factor-like domains protein 11 [Pomacea canaliculata]|uniref:multiple epidermal growth factor-like domains protein 11 n=1 Tax=Pomacea canaliculata TaxID=400727 RepID=UPI000D72DF45|nr:multiple epidermal growth factor-like domains protein 11 [Pomacea canaliculata]